MSRFAHFLSRLLLFSLLLGLPTSAQANFHLWDVTEVFSNADGSVQFVEFFAVNNGQAELFNHDITSTGVVFDIPHDLGTADPIGNPNGGGAFATANQHFLVATPGFAALPGAPTPDYVFDSTNFMSTVADTVSLAGADSLSFTSGQLPTDGKNSLNEDFGGTNRQVAINSPTNFAGVTGSIDVSSPPPVPSVGRGGMMWMVALVIGAAVALFSVRSSREADRPTG